MKTGDELELHGVAYRVAARKKVGSTMIVRLDAVGRRVRPRYVIGPEAHLGGITKVGVKRPRKTSKKD